MHRNTDIRELAMQVLFTFDAGGVASAETAEQVVADTTVSATRRRDAIVMAQSAWEAREVADTWMERLSPNWPPRRQPLVDRNILRLALWELTNTKISPKIIMDEAIELARSFSTENSPGFINGVLDAAVKEHMALISEAPPAPPRDENPNDETRNPNP